MNTIEEPPRQTPVIAETDLCVVGGSCTGVFAAVRAARLGLKVVLIEKLNAFGGVATNGLVCVWHSLLNTTHDRKIIGGLTEELINRLRTREACRFARNSPDMGSIFNSEELKIELDELLREHGIEVMLHTSFAAPVINDGKLDAVIVENKSGRQAVRARCFIDASGDGDLAAAAGIPFTVDPHLQPPTTCAKIRGLAGLDLRTLYNNHCHEYGLPRDAGWDVEIPQGQGIRMHANTHVFGVDVSDARQLTHAEMEGRRSIRALMDMVRKHHPERIPDLNLLALSSSIGARESRHFKTIYGLTEDDVLNGIRFPDAIANGSYRVDVHHPEGGGWLLKYLDGTQTSYTHAGREDGRWRDPVAENPTFYQIPYRSIIAANVPNLILAGRMLGCDRNAFGAVRVMVNLNQVGEAAGVAASIALEQNVAVQAVDTALLRDRLKDGGSTVL